MKRINRRRFLVAGAAAAASLNLARCAWAATPASPRQTAKLTLHVEQTGPRVPQNFVGLSYETQQLSEPEFFSPANSGLIAELRALAPHGVLRLGGNTSDYGFWKPTPTSTAPPRAKRPYKIGDPPPDLSYAVTPEAVQNLRGFLDATGWTCLYGINFGTNTPELAADEAEFVSQTLGERLEYFQVGNEADRFGSTIRDPKTWTADAYFDEWLSFAKAIGARVPGAKFGLPDTSGKPEWYAVVVTRLLALPEGERPKVGALTHHYYFSGPPDNPKANIENMLRADAHVDSLAKDIRAAAARLSEAGPTVPYRMAVPYRMTEGNTCYRGGKPGLSDVFAASLWSADYLLKLASLGYAGVNLHGGGAKVIATGLGGLLPGEALMNDAKVPHPKPFYTPIADIDGTFVAEPVSFGMRLAQQFAGATMVKVDFDPGEVNATAYAAKRADGRTLVAVINKDATRDLEIATQGFRASVVYRLTADSLTSTAVKFIKVPQARGLTVPAGSAAILEAMPMHPASGVIA